MPEIERTVARSKGDSRTGYLVVEGVSPKDLSDGFHVGERDLPSASYGVLKREIKEALLKEKEIGK